MPQKPQMPSPDAGQVYFEFTHVGQLVRVAAVDASTGVEVIVMGPAVATQKQLQTLALRKLQMRLRQGIR